MDKKKEYSYHIKDVPVMLSHRVVNPNEKHEELLHWHDEIELIRIKHGSIHCHVNDSDFLLFPGELCCINYNQMHRLYNAENEMCEMDVLIIRTEMMSYNSAVYDKYIKSIINNHDFSHIQMTGRSSGAKMISDIFDSLYELFENKTDGYELDIIGYIHMIFRRIYLAYNSEKKLTYYDTDTSIQRRMSSYIYDNYQERISLDEIARSGGVSKSKCANLFIKYTQMTPVEFLNRYRLDMSVKLLCKSNESISSIALDCGFGEQSYFNRLFKREFGITPASYRKTSCEIN